MKASELLSELRENILHDRSDRTSGANDYLWTDATLYRYINEAHKRFARGSFCIWDKSTPEVTRLTLKTGQTDYPVHASVLAIVSARHSGDNYDLARTGHTVLDGWRPPDSQYFDVNSPQTSTPGKPLAYSTDDRLSPDEYGTMTSVTLRVFPAPSAEYNDTYIDLRVVRMPIVEISSTQASLVPEVPEMHHLEMLDWAAYLALRIADTDAGNPSLAKTYRESFEGHVKEASKLARRKLFAPIPWAFGRNGFSWEA